MKYTLNAYSFYEIGPRPKQEDSMFPDFGELKESDRLFIVCDGMGGHSAGEVASSTICKEMGESVLRQCPDAEGEFTDDNLRQALSDAIDALDLKDNGAEKKMGTTMTFLKLHDKGATIAHIGDSRVYHVRPGATPAETEILFQTVDHSLVNDLVKIGELTPEEAKHSKQKNIITRAIQPNMERRPRADIYHTHDIKPGDYFMLCSDGVLEQMEDDNIKYIFSDKVGGPEAKVDMLIQVTSQNHDNHTAILVRINDVIDPIPVLPQPLLCEVESDEAPLSPEGDSMNPASEQTAVPNMRKNGKKTIIAIVAAAVVTCLLVLVLMLVFGRDDEESAPEEVKKVQVVQGSATQERADRDGNVVSQQKNKLGRVTDRVVTDRVVTETDYSETANQIKDSEQVEVITSEVQTQSEPPITPDTPKNADVSSAADSVGKEPASKESLMGKAFGQLLKVASDFNNNAVNKQDTLTGKNNDLNKEQVDSIEENLEEEKHYPFI